MDTNEKAFDALVYLSSIIANSMDMSKLKEMLKRDLDLSDIQIDLPDLASHVDVEDVSSHIDLYELANYHIDQDELASHIDIDHEAVASNVDMDELTAYLGAEGKEKMEDMEQRFYALCQDVEGLTSFKKEHEQMMEQIALEHERMQRQVDAMSKALSIRIEELVEAKSQILGLQDLTCDLNLAVDHLLTTSFRGRMRSLWRWIKKTCRL